MAPTSPNQSLRFERICFNALMSGRRRWKEKFPFLGFEKKGREEGGIFCIMYIAIVNVPKS